MTSGPARVEAGRPNPGFIKLELFCQGLRLAPDLRLPGEGEGDARTVRRVRAGLGSGLELRIGEVAVNAPVTEPFAASSPYELHGPDADGRYRLQHDGRPLVHVAVPPTPRFYGLETSSGKPMATVGAMQGSYLGVYYGGLCANWKRPESDACRFCGLGCSVASGDERTDKTVQDVVEVAQAARRELGITFVHVNGGFDDRGGYVERFLPLIEALTARTGLLLGLQIPPLTDASAYRAFARAGVDNLSLCFEAWDGAHFDALCPGKARRAGLDGYRAALEACRGLFPTTNGELIAGVEPPASTCEAIDWLVGIGAVPTVCVLRPLADTPLAGQRPPAAQTLAPVFAHLYRRCMEAGLPIGVAPGLAVSIVLMPSEARWLLPPAERRRWPLRRVAHAGLRHLLGWRVARRARRALGVDAR